MIRKRRATRSGGMHGRQVIGVLTKRASSRAGISRYGGGAVARVWLSPLVHGKSLRPSPGVRVYLGPVGHRYGRPNAAIGAIDIVGVNKGDTTCAITVNARWSEDCLIPSDGTKGGHVSADGSDVRNSHRLISERTACSNTS